MTLSLCGLCHGTLSSEWVFCRRCGHPVGEAVFPQDLRRRFRLEHYRGNRSEEGGFDLFLFVSLLLASTIWLAWTVEAEDQFQWQHASVLTVLSCLWILRRGHDTLGGLARPGFGWRGIACIVAACPVIYLFSGAWAAAVSGWFPVGASARTIALYGSEWSWTWILVLVAILPAFFEELAFRGVIQKGLERMRNPSESLVITAAIFALLHLDFWMWPFLFLFGLYLGWLRNRSRSLYPPMLAHLGHNLLVVAGDYQALAG